MGYKYALIEPSTVDYETRRAAHMALATARKELRLPWVNIKWFEHIQFVKKTTETFEDESWGIRGRYSGKTPDTIYIKAGQFPEKIQETVLHETFHLLQFLNGSLFIDIDGCEDRADAYAAATMRRMAVNDSETESVYFEHIIGKDWASERNQREMDRRLGKPQGSANE